MRIKNANDILEELRECNNPVTVSSLKTIAISKLKSERDDLLEACIGLCHYDLTGEQFAMRLSFAQRAIAKAKGES